MKRSMATASTFKVESVGKRSDSNLEISRGRKTQRNDRMTTYMNKTDFKDSAILKLERYAHSMRSFGSSKPKKEDIYFMKKMRDSIHQKVVCKNGPICANHDWNKRSPIRKVCTRDENCVNHDWSRVDRKNSPFKVVCAKGSGCKNHDWGGRSPMVARVDRPAVVVNQS
jgi:hypothetical protein